MADPVYVSQTFELEHVGDPLAAREWFQEQGRAAHERGATWPRMTVNEDCTGLLFEAWVGRPQDEGAPRWSLNKMERP